MILAFSTILIFVSFNSSIPRTTKLSSDRKKAPLFNKEDDEDDETEEM